MRVFIKVNNHVVQQTLALDFLYLFIIIISDCLSKKRGHKMISVFIFSAEKLQRISCDFFTKLSATI